MRGHDQQIKVHYKGTSNDFIVFVESAKAVQDWKADKSVPLVQVLDSFKVFVTNKQGNQGQLDAAPKRDLENEFGTSNEDEAIAKILEGGSVVETQSSERSGTKNISQGGTVAH